MGSRNDDPHNSKDACLPHQAAARAVAVHRDNAEFVDGRAYPATSRMHVDGEQMKFDLIANMYAVIHGEVTGPCADILTALALAYTEDHQGLLASISADEAPPRTTTEMIDSFRRFFEEGVLGRDEKGGYVNFERLHAAHA